MEDDYLMVTPRQDDPLHHLSNNSVGKAKPNRRTEYIKATPLHHNSTPGVAVNPSLRNRSSESDQDFSSQYFTVREDTASPRNEAQVDSSEMEFSDTKKQSQYHRNGTIQDGGRS